MVRRDDHAQGVLIDFSSALYVDDARNPSKPAHYRIGMAPFVAVELCTAGKPRLAEYRHDLESFFWTLWWITVQYENGKLREWADNPMIKWYTGKWAAIRRAKKGALKKPDLQYFSNTFQDLSAWIASLAKFFTAPKTKTLDDKDMYNEFRARLVL